MRQIKFRGRVPMSDKVYGGKIVYGYLVVYENEHEYTHWIYTEGAECNYPVEPESVAQLIAVDKNGREVYEGDKVAYSREEPDAKFEDCIVECRWDEHAAAFDDYRAILDGEVILVEPKP